MFLAFPWLEIDFQTGHFADFEHFKIDSSLTDFGKVNIDPTGSFLLLWGCLSNFTELGKMLGREKQSKYSPFDKKFKN